MRHEFEKELEAALSEPGAIKYKLFPIDDIDCPICGLPLFVKEIIRSPRLQKCFEGIHYEEAGCSFYLACEDECDDIIENIHHPAMDILTLGFKTFEEALLVAVKHFGNGGGLYMN